MPLPKTALNISDQHQLIRVLQSCAAVRERCRRVGEDTVLPVDRDEAEELITVVQDAADALEIAEHWCRQIVFPATFITEDNPED